MYILVYTCRCSYKYESVILPVLSPCKFPKCKHNKISAASTYSSSRLLEGHDRNTVFQTTGWFLALLSVRTLQTKSLCLCSHWQIKQRKRYNLILNRYCSFIFMLFWNQVFFRYNYIIFLYFGFFRGIFKQLVFKKHSLICNYINFNSEMAFGWHMLFFL